MSYRSVEKYVTSVSSNIPERALEAVRESRVLLLISRGSRRRLFVFKSRDRDYLIIPRILCTCKDYEFNVVFRRSKPACYHLIATELAIREGRVREVSVGDADFSNILYEVVYDGFSRTLRRVIAEKNSTGSSS
ncbi:MAG: SWIM zinc finger family protein [Desulfurococcales archaeon]|nr:SWIM zinc finger family protein [Desulfurococcales archaeon]